VRALLFRHGTRPGARVLVVVLVEGSVALSCAFQRVPGRIFGLVRAQTLSVRTSVLRLHLLMLEAEVPTHGDSLHFDGLGHDSESI